MLTGPKWVPQKKPDGPGFVRMGKVDGEARTYRGCPLKADRSRLIADSSKDPAENSNKTPTIERENRATRFGRTWICLIHKHLTASLRFSTLPFTFINLSASLSWLKI
jgi:hypothetical protein